MLQIPSDAAWILSRLNQAGYQAYVVGGCVRDALLGRAPQDWDICTSARPEQLQAVFGDCHVVATGLKHGTLTVVLHHTPYEVTTFRVDGAYTDHRHPDQVSFVDQVTADLSRRDFTVNAMAYHPDTGLIDCFDGQKDLSRGVIRCVGDAEVRFTEDALRILRALRFASVYGFAIDPATGAAVHHLADTLSQVARERIHAELTKLLLGQGCESILRDYADVITVILPQLSPMQGFLQHTPYHQFDVWEHTLRAVGAVPPTETLRLTMLLHDSGKPACFTMDDDGVGHAYGHQTKSTEIAREVLSGLRVDNATTQRVLTLVEHHDLPLSPNDSRMMKRRLNQLGEDALRELIEVQRADAMGKGTMTAAEIEDRTSALRSALEALLAEKPCVTLKQLAVNGRDLTQAGIPAGKAIGDCLRHLLEQVIDGALENDRAALIAAAQREQNKFGNDSNGGMLHD